MAKPSSAFAFVVIISLALPIPFESMAGTEDLICSMIGVADWLVENQNPGGTFNLKMSDTHEDYQDALILGCAAIVLLDAYKITGDIKYLEAANLTLSLLSSWQEADGEWTSHSRYAAGGAYYPIIAFSKFKIYTNSSAYMDTTLKAADSLIEDEEGSVRYFYIFEMGERSYALLLVWKATNISRYKSVVDGWVSFLQEAFNYKIGAWNTRVDGKGPQGMWDAVLPALPLLAYDYDKLRELANRSLCWATRNLKAFEAGAYIACSPRGEISLSDQVYRDKVNAYTHFTAEFLILASILGKEAEAEEAASWLISMQAPDGGFYFRKSPDGSVDRREYVWDSFWAFFGLYTYLQAKLSKELRNMICEISLEMKDAGEKGANTSLCEHYISIAEEKFNSGEYFTALDYVKMANKTLRSSVKTFEAINKAKFLIYSSKRVGVNVTRAERKLSLALEAYKKGDFESGLELALEAEDIVNSNLMEMKSEANRILEETEELLGEARDLGVNITEADVLLEEALKLYSEGNYSGSIELAKRAQDSARKSVILAKIRRTKKILGAILSIAIVSSLIFLLKRRSIKDKE